VQGARVHESARQIQAAKWQDFTRPKASVRSKTQRISPSYFEATAAQINITSVVAALCGVFCDGIFHI